MLCACVRAFEGRGGGVERVSGKRGTRSRESRAAARCEFGSGAGGSCLTCLPVCPLLWVSTCLPPLSLLSLSLPPPSSLSLSLSLSRYRVGPSRHFCFQRTSVTSERHQNPGGTMLTLLTSMYLVVRAVSSQAEPIRVVVTGAAGQIAYSLLYSIAKGDVFGKDQPIILILLDIPPMLPVLEGVVMELQDCALPLLREVIPTDKVEVGFKDIDAAILVGSMPRKEGMERKDLLKANVAIFKTQGSALDKYAKKTVKVLVVGNPANTNCLIASKSAPSIPKENFSCLTRLDHNRACSQVAMRCSVSSDNVKNVIIWGNHSSTQYPDVHHAKVTVQGSEMGAYEVVKDDAWLRGDFISTVQQRGAAVIKARKLSSAMSAAKAICDHMRDIWFGTKEGEFISMGVYAAGNTYGIPEDLIYSFPVQIKNKTWKMIDGLSINDFSRAKMDATAAELVEERDTALDFLGQ